jgi:hypothetical protein
VLSIITLISNNLMKNKYNYMTPTLNQSPDLIEYPYLHPIALYP